ncbi:glycerophosphodiester phosphodiesterase [Glaciecola sp. 1036]|uniref:glycerophosphodiester phosphodiesterase n=1 Tax=Alteromonadaceae TaxID=72275 RepID=UPI003D00FA0B
MRFTFFLSLFFLHFSSQAFDIIAHRGASGFLPEHTREAAVLAYMQGADYIEQDIVATKDKKLIVLHDIHLERVTNVETMYPTRHREDGRYYAADFTLDELKTLLVHEREDENGEQVFSNRYKGKSAFRIATFEEHIEMIFELNRLFNKNVGLYPEIKSPEFHLAEGIDITALVMQTLNKFELNSSSDNIYVQCFYPPTLDRIRTEFKSQIKLVQLIAENSWAESSTDYDALKSSQGLKKVAEYADAIGPWIPQILTPEFAATELLVEAKTLGLKIHPYTFREDAPAYPIEPSVLFKTLLSVGIDGIFTDQVLPYMLELKEALESSAEVNH